jgi:hypothetical protein
MASDDDPDICYKRTVVCSILTSWGLFAVVTALLFSWELFHDAAFFTVDINNNETRPEVLDVPITDIWKHRFFCVFFFCNSFLSEWNGVVINAIFGRMEVGCGGESLYDGDEATFPKFCGIGGKVRTEKLKLFSLFTAYERKYKCGGLMPRILFVRKIM